MRGVNCHLPRDVAALQQRRGDFRQLRIPDRDGGNNALSFILLDQFEIGRHFVRRKRKRFLNLNPDHLRKLRWIDSGQPKSLREHGRNGQPEHQVVLRRQQRHGFL